MCDVVLKDYGRSRVHLRESFLIQFNISIFTRLTIECEAVLCQDKNKLFLFWHISLRHRYEFATNKLLSYYTSLYFPSTTGHGVVIMLDVIVICKEIVFMNTGI